jgi:hypothetical protein
MMMILLISRRGVLTSQPSLIKAMMMTMMDGKSRRMIQSPSVRHLKSTIKWSPRSCNKIQDSLLYRVLEAIKLVKREAALDKM